MQYLLLLLRLVLRLFKDFCKGTQIGFSCFLIGIKDYDRNFSLIMTGDLVYAPAVLVVRRVKILSS